MQIRFHLLPHVLALVFSTLLGCTANEQIRTNFDPTTGNRNKAVIESNDDYTLGYVEFDDQGQFWDLCQRKAVEQMIANEAGINSPNQTPQPIILVAFVHGWKDNAQYNDSCLSAMKHILIQLNIAEHTQPNPRKIVGVYLAWRGLSQFVEPFKELSFWGRKETAHKVGGYGSMTEMFVDLANLQSKSQKSLVALHKPSPPTELIIIGHSFGAAAVYSALSQMITERFVNSVPLGTPLQPIGDQIILLNPAFEAQRYYDLYQMAQAIKTFPQNQRPVFSVFTSKGDSATQYFFPIGQFFSTLFDATRDCDQWTRGLQTIAWYKLFRNHELKFNPNTSQTTSLAGTWNPQTQQHELHNRAQMRRSIANIKRQRAKWHPNAAKPQTYNFDDTILAPIDDDYRPGDPFIIGLADKQIMANHDDIDNPVLINFLREYVQFCESGTTRPSQ
jgi:hypothetical protein